MKHLLICSILASLCLTSSLPAAESLSVVPDSAQALGIVGGRLANLDDPSAVRVSPANILGINETELLINGAVWHGDIRFDAASGASIRMSEPWVFPASMYLVAPYVPGKVTFGLGVSTPFGLATEYPRDMDLRLRYVLPYEARLLAVDITPAVAFQLTDRLAVAVGLDIVYSKLTLKQAYPWGLLVPGAREGSIELEGDGWGLGGYVGINWKIAEHQRVAIVGRLPVTVNYDGDMTADRMPAALEAAGFTRKSKFESDMTFPGSIAVGYGIDLTNRWTLGFDFQWSNNSSHDDIPLSIGNNQALLPWDRAVLEWKDSIDLGTGISYAVDKNWALRAGYLFSENSMPALNYTPSVAANDRHVFSAGIGWHGKSRSVDFAYAFVYNPERVISSDVQPAFDGIYKHQWHVFSLSFTQRF